jgi:hypothetical protein
MIYQLPAACWVGYGSNPASFGELSAILSTTNLKGVCLRFDDTTEEYVVTFIEAPKSPNTGGTVTFRVHMYAETPAASKNVAATMSHVATDHNEDGDGSFTDEDSGDKAVQYTASEDRLTIFEWTETWTNLGWTAEDKICLKLSMPQASADNLTDDRLVVLVVIDVPES